jgi:formylglycine-generating enzyme
MVSTFSHTTAVPALALLGACAMSTVACGQASPRPEVPSLAPTATHPQPPVQDPRFCIPNGPQEVRVSVYGAVRDGGVELPSADAASALIEPEWPDAGARTVAVPAREAACPADMKLVDTRYCPDIKRKCLDEEYSPQNHIFLCHRFAKQQQCLVPEEHRRFCIDEYEYPNRAGAHPPWMVSWYDAQATCQLQHKRVCYESEWISACEGPDRTPFPYGYARDNAKCNIDNQWIKPSLEKMYSSNRDVAGPELSRLDQSVPSGARADCVSGFGVHDMTGNFDEWVTADVEHKDKSQWAGLKGGAWGHVRNACRPVTTSHPPDFTYYFIAFRCCKDAADAKPYVPAANPGIPAVPPADRAPLPNPVNPPGPSAKKVGREHWKNDVGREHSRK